MPVTEIKIDKMGLMGQGVGVDPGGNIYFVPGSVPGDTVRVTYEETVKKYRDAELEAVVIPSSERQDPRCQYFQDCGGCDWLHWDYNAQLKAKEGIVRHVLQRGSIEAETWLPTQGSPKIWGYRNRIQLRQEGDKLGFYRKKSHDIVDIERCEVAHPGLNEAMKGLRSEAVQGRRKVEMMIENGGEVRRIDNANHAALGFRQINEEQNAYLQSRVAHYVKKSGSKKVLELYCGDGNFSFSYLPMIEELIAIESNERAVEAARANKEKLEIKTQAAFFAQTVDKRLLAKLPQEFKANYDTLILDPPRDGMQGALGACLGQKVRQVIYISCSPVSFSKDVECLQKDFVLREIQAVDMFPHTRHIELIAFFEKR